MSNGELHVQEDSGAFDPRVVNAVAYGIARVVATATVEADGKLSSLDGLGKATAIHTMAAGMVGMLQAEALAAIGAFLRAAEGEV